MMDKITFKLLEKSRANEYFGSCDAVRTETVHANGLVEGRLMGTWDGRDIDERYTRNHGPVDLNSVREARIEMGWSVG
jgi:hypothetical protein